jgi:hypothetical protein
MKGKIVPFFTGVLVSVMVIGLSVTALAENGLIHIDASPINVLVNGEVFQPKDVNGNDVAIFNWNGTTYAPLRALAEAYGLEVGYDSEKNLATVNSPSSVVTQESKLYSGANVSVTYQNISTVEGVSGAFLVNLQMENTGSEPEVYYLRNVYVDDLACQSGTGVPVTADAGKKANGSFIIFCSEDITQIKKVEFQIVIANSDTFSTIETSETITIIP